MSLHPSWRKLLLVGVIVASLAVRAQPGTVDSAFDPGTGVTGPFSSVAKVVEQLDGKILIAGAFDQYQGVPRGGLARLFPDGLIDIAYSPPLEFEQGLSQVDVIAVDNAGRCLVGGGFYVPGVGYRTLIRLNTSGALDSLFNQNLGVGTMGGRVQHIAIKNNGNIVIGGTFTGVNGHARTGIAEILEDGSLNILQSFQGGFIDSEASNLLPTIRAIRIGPNEEVFVLGSFTHYGWDNQPARGLARIAPDGTLVQQYSLSIDVPAGPGNLLALRDLCVDSNGAALVAGSFVGINGTNASVLVRLLPDGQVDSAFGFNPLLFGNTATPSISRIVTDGFGGYIALGDLHDGGPFDLVVGINSNGSPASEFHPTSLSYDFSAFSPYDVLLTSSGDLIVGGPFSSCDGVTRNRVARIHGLYGPALWYCLNTQPISLPVNESLIVEGDTIAWHELMVEQCMQLTVRTCSGSGINQMADGLYTSCPAYPDSIIAYDAIEPNTCGGEDRVIEELPQGTYWLAVEASNGPYSFTVYNTLCGPVDCQGTPGGPAIPGTPCDDGNIATINDTWGTDCICQGEPDLNLDCAGTPDGPAVPGTPCDDGIFFTTNDAWATNCICAGFDCAGQQGGTALPGTPCDDQDPGTAPDIWSADCLCGTLTGMHEGQHGLAVLSVRPNPVTGQSVEVLFGRLPQGPLSIRLMDASERVVHSLDVPPPQDARMQVDRSGVPVGFYFLELQGAHGRTLHRIVLQ